MRGLQCLLDSQAADGEFVDVQLAGAGAADEDPPYGDCGDCQRPDGQRAKGERTERLCADCKGAHSHGAEFDQGEMLLVVLAHGLHDGSDGWAVEPAASRV